MAVAVDRLASSTVSLHPRRCVSSARIFSCFSSQVCMQVRCACADSVSYHHSLQLDRRKLSLHLALAMLPLQWQGCVDVAYAGDTDMPENVIAFVDPTEVTKTGKRLPRSYVQSAREVVRTLREALQDDVQKDLKNLGPSKAAKEAIRVYLSTLRSSKHLLAEDSFQALTKALRILGQFYLTAGPMASLPQDVKATVLQNLDRADAAL